MLPWQVLYTVSQNYNILLVLYNLSVLNVYISQGSAATYLRCAANFNTRFVENFILFLTVKKFRKLDMAKLLPKFNTIVFLIHNIYDVTDTTSLTSVDVAHSRTMSQSNSAWKLGFSLDTRVHSALETLHSALYKSTYHFHCHQSHQMTETSPIWYMLQQIFT